MVLSHIIVVFCYRLQLEYDYEDIIYPIPFNVLYYNKSSHYVSFGEVNPIFPSYVLTGDLPECNNQYSDKMFITAASSNHAYGSFNLMYSILLANPYASILYIDLKISQQLLRILSSHFVTLRQIQEKMRSNGYLAYRKYNWHNFPEWMNLFKNKVQRGGYSWKVIPMVDAFFEWKGLFSWLDAGDLIIDGIEREFTLARKYGFFSPPSPGRIGNWTYYKTIDFLKEYNMISHVNNTDPNCNANSIFIDYSKPYTHEMMRKHEECAYTQKCIAPRGSTMKNHRQDQAVLSTLINDYKIPMAMKRNFHPALRNENAKVQTLYNLVITIMQEYHIQLNNTYYDYSSIQYKQTPISYSSRTLDY